MAPDKKKRKAPGSSDSNSEQEPKKLSRRDFLKSGYSRAIASLLLGGAAVSHLSCGKKKKKYSDYSYYDYYSNYYSRYYSDYYNYYSNYYDNYAR